MLLKNRVLPSALMQGWAFQSLELMEALKGTNWVQPVFLSWDQ